MSIKSHLTGWAVGWQTEGKMGEVAYGGTHAVWEGLALCFIQAGVRGKQRDCFPRVQVRSVGLGPDARGFPSPTPICPLES